MEETATVGCPYCGQVNELAVDPGQREAVFTTDCEVCCRPFEVRATWTAEQIPVLEVLGT